MTDHVAALGFGSLDLDAFEALVYMAVEQGSPLLSPLGSYVAWSPGDGIELWAQADRTPQLLGAHPHFRGSSCLTLEDVHAEPDPEFPLEGLARGHVAGQPLSLQPVTFDAWAFEHEAASSARFQVCAFAHALEVLDDPETPLSWRPLNDHPEGPSVCDLTVRLVQAHTLRNPSTYERFYHLVVELADGIEIDAVLPTKMLRKRPRQGLILSGEFWLSAMPLDGAGAMAPA